MKRSTLVLVLGKTRVLSFSYEISLGKNERTLVFYETALVSRFCSSRPRILVLVQALGSRYQSYVPSYLLRGYQGNIVLFSDDVFQFQSSDIQECSAME